MLTRTQLLIDSELLQKARGKATELGVSLAGYVRTLLRNDLSEVRPVTSVSSIFALGHSSGSDIRKNKVAYLSEAFAKGRRRKTGKR